jgi:hypothetical protein
MASGGGNIQTTTFVLGRAFFHCYSNDSPMPMPPANFAAIGMRHLMPIWPAAGPVNKPERAITDEDAFIIAGAIPKGLQESNTVPPPHQFETFDRRDFGPPPPAAGPKSSD